MHKMQFKCQLMHVQVGGRVLLGILMMLQMSKFPQEVH